MSGAEQTRKSWRYPRDKLNRNLLGRTSGLSADAPGHSTSPSASSCRTHGRPFTSMGGMAYGEHSIMIKIYKNKKKQVFPRCKTYVLLHDLQLYPYDLCSIIIET